MRNIWAIFRKEMKSYFASPIAYVVAAIFLMVSGFLFALNLISSQEASLRGLLGTTGIILLFLAPVLTMRLLAEEQHSGTIELLLTAPVRDMEVVLGKFLAALLLLLAMLGLSLFFPFLLYFFGTPDSGPIVTGYLGVFLSGAAFMSVGLLTSSFTRNQIVAAVVAIGMLLLFWFIHGAGNYLGGALAGVLRYVSLSQHIDDFLKGVIDARDLVYYLSFTAVFLFLTVRSLETRRWR